MELTTDQWLQSLWMALRRIETNLALPPAPLELPEIRIEPPDLSAIVTAVTSLNGTGPTAEEIARAIAAVIAPPPAATSGGAEALEAVARALEKLDFRMQGMGKQAFGGGAVDLSAAAIAAITGAGSGGSSGGLTDVQLRATPVPVSGTVATGALTDVQLRATPLPVSGTVGVTQPVAVTDNAGSLTIDSTQLPAALGTNGALKVEGVASGTAQPISGTVTANAGSGPFPVSDNAGSLTVDAPVGTPAFVRLSDGTAAITALPVTDNAGSLTVDSTQLPAALAANGGIKVEGVAGGVAQPVSGTVTANAGTGPFPVSDNAGSLTVDAPVGTPAFVRLSDGAAAITTLPVNNSQVAGTAVSVNNGVVDAGTQRVTLASNGTGVVGLAAGSATIGALTANQSVNNAQIAGTAVSTSSRVTDAGVQSVFQAAPASANILVGHVAHTATTAAATVITIPANRTWMGTITVTCDGSNTGAVTTAGQALGLIATTGANTIPAAATVVSCEARWGANVTAGTVGTQGANSITVPMVVQTGASGATTTLASTITGTAGRVACICSGYLM